MDYRTRRYKEGLSGKKPSSFHFDKAAHRAQAAGYRDHLRNQDLAERIRQQHENDSGGSYESSPPKPLEPWQRALWISIGIVLLICDLSVSAAFADYNTARMADPSTAYWGVFVASVFIVPGGIFGWPGLLLIGAATDRST